MTQCSSPADEVKGLGRRFWIVIRKYL